MAFVAVAAFLLVLELVVRAITEALPYTAEVSLVDRLLSMLGLHDVTLRYSIPSKLIFVAAGITLFLSLMKSMK